MPRLMLLRHGKAASPEAGEDFERPLTRRGREAAARMGTYLTDEGLTPDLVLVSTARRARETFHLARAALAEVASRPEPTIYEASADQLLALARGTEAGIGSLLLVGHNPGFETLALLLSGSGEGDALDRLERKFPTAALAVIEADGGWDALQRGRGRLTRFVTPRSLGAAEDD